MKTTNRPVLRTFATSGRKQLMEEAEAEAEVVETGVEVRDKALVVAEVENYLRSLPRWYPCDPDGTGGRPRSWSEDPRYPSPQCRFPLWMT